MTAPVQPSAPADWNHIPTWCTTCQIHRATNHRPICPVCLDKRDREAKS